MEGFNFEAAHAQGQFFNEGQHFDEAWAEGDVHHEEALQQHFENLAIHGDVPADQWAKEFQAEHESAEQWIEGYKAENNDQALFDTFEKVFDGTDTGEEWANEFSSAHPVEETSRAELSSLVNRLTQNGDPKFRDSKFVDFISRMSRGEITIQGDQVIQHAPQPVEAVAESLLDADEQEFEQAWAGLNEQGDMDDLTKAWQSLWPLEGTLGLGGTRDLQYEFAQENPFWEEPEPLPLAERLSSEGNIKDAILALEVEVQRNPESSDGWRMLGGLHAENDEDPRAIACLQKGHEVDPYNIDLLLILGVSCTNEMDSLQALTHLRNYLIQHPDYQAMDMGQLPPTEDVEQMRQHVTELFLKAQNIAPDDPDVQVALGVLFNISREYPLAVECFSKALRARPYDPSLWNKLGATLANSSKSAEAVDAYYKSLEHRPCYVRAWANLGIAHSNQGKYMEAARFYLCALSLNPNAKHLWSYLHTAFECAGRTDLASRISAFNVDVFRDEFDIVTVETLPPPGPSDANEWSHEFISEGHPVGGPAGGDDFEQYYEA
eukprot:GILJ01004216.1.p1 GENE.GILJ01004216.1~~GILJ01004216.1.p1  ORF type:complete len:619 (+),score=99.94 GILJ01004216.1:211-1857(+)